MSYRAYKYRIYPTQEQAELINKTIGCCRFVYNMLLDDCKKQYEQTGKSKVQSYATLKPKYEWLSEVDATALNYSRKALQTAYDNFFKRHLGFPTFHSKKDSRQSYTSQNISNTIRIEKGKLRLPKVGLVKTIFHRYCYGKIKTATVSRTKTNKYFVSVMVELPPTVTETTVKDKTLGVDMSFHGDFAVYSDGTKINFPNYYLKSLDKITRLNRKFARSKSDSHNHEKLRLRLARVYEKVSNQLKDWQEKESLRIANTYNVVTFEDINLQSIAKMGHGKKVLNNGFGEFRTLTERKVNEHLGIFIKADKWFPSSQICNVCGFRNKETKNLSVINYSCPECGTQHNRDINASKNLQRYGEIIAAMANVTPKQNACGGCCKTCRETHCALIRAGSDEASKVEGLRKPQAL